MASRVLEPCQSRKMKPQTPAGSFRESIRLFLRQFAKIQDFSISRMPVWIAKGIGGSPLYTIEETVENSLNPFCNHCKSTGWGHHFVSKRRYHFIIPESDRLESDMFEVGSHALYGVVHCNGYGHLICVNGRKGDSKFASGDAAIMDFWDGLCSAVRTREISVRDDLNTRLLSLVVNGEPWCGRWGYEFSSGSFGVTNEQYYAAVEYLKSLSLDKIISDLRKKEKGRKIRQIISKYRSMCDVPLFTLRDLFIVMVSSQSSTQIRKEVGIRRARQDVMNSGKNGEAISCVRLATLLGNSCRWPKKRILDVLGHVVSVLERNLHSYGGKDWMSRQELRDMVRLYVGDTGLIDFVLKSVTCFAMGDHIVRRSVNLSTKKLQFKIHRAVEGASGTRHGDFVVKNDRRIDIDKRNLDADAIYLSRNLLFCYCASVRCIRDRLNFVKKWQHQQEQLMVVECKVLPSFEELEKELNRPLSPGETVTVTPLMTISELKAVAQEALMDTYCIMNDFEVSQIGGLKEVDGGEVVSGTIKPGMPVWVRGSGMDFGTKLRYEDGNQKNVVVDCSCGTTQDDGQRLIACDACQVCQHTRCMGIADHQPTPLYFLCSGCDSERLE